MSHANKATQRNFFRELAKQAQQVLPDSCPVDSGGLGGFPFYYETTKGFQESTWNYINSSANISKDNDVILTGDLFESFYQRYLNNVTYDLSTKDSETLNKALANADDKAVQLIKEYERTFEEITKADMEGAKVRTKIDYIVDYQVRRVWADQSKPFDIGASDVTELEQQLPNMPTSGRKIINVMFQYFQAIRSAAPIVNSQIDALNRLDIVRANAKKPDRLNGGLKVFPLVGQESYRIRYNPDKDPDQIKKELDNKNSKIALKFSASNRTDGTAELKLGSNAFGVIGWGGLLGIATDSTSYTLDQFWSSQKKCDISITITGLSVLHFPPSRYSGGKYWFAADILKEAVANDGKDVSGYEFAGDIPVDQVAGLPMLQALAFGNPPSIQITYYEKSVTARAEELKKANSLTISLFGIPLASASARYQKAEVAMNESEEKFTITINPPARSGNLFNHRALALAAKVGYPFKPARITEARAEEARMDGAPFATTETAKSVYA
jgi:hypothetical protein